VPVRLADGARLVVTESPIHELTLTGPAVAWLCAEPGISHVERGTLRAARTADASDYRIVTPYGPVTYRLATFTLTVKADAAGFVSEEGTVFALVPKSNDKIEPVPPKTARVLTPPGPVLPSSERCAFARKAQAQVEAMLADAGGDWLQKLDEQAVIAREQARVECAIDELLRR
jgi:hypothetical protein